MFKVYYQNYNEMFEEIQNLVSYKNNEYYYSLTKIEESINGGFDGGYTSKKFFRTTRNLKKIFKDIAGDKWNVGDHFPGTYHYYNNFDNWFKDDYRGEEKREILRFIDKKLIEKEQRKINIINERNGF